MMLRKPAPAASGWAWRFAWAARPFWWPARKLARCWATPRWSRAFPARKAGSRGWRTVRGKRRPMLDLRQLLGSGATASGRNTRVVVVNHREIPAGLMVDEVLGFRRFAEPEFNAEAPPTVIRCDSYLAGAFRRGGEVWPVLSLKSLVESQSFLQAAS